MSVATSTPADRVHRSLAPLARHRTEIVAWLVVAVAVAALRHSVPAYVLTLAVSARISRISPAGGLALGFVWLGAIGTEFRPVMLGLAGPQVRLLDFVWIGALLGALPELRLGRPSTATALLIGAVLATLPALRPDTLSVGFASGHQIVLGVIAYLLARRACARCGGVGVLVSAIVFAAVLAGVKATALWAGGIDVTGGPDSPLQAVSRVEPIVFSRRTLLIGGALLCVLSVPLGLGQILARVRSSRWLPLIVMLPLFAVFVSLTRTSMIAAIVGAAILALTVRTSSRVNGRAVTVIVAATWIGALTLTWQSTTTPWGSAVGRFTSGEARDLSLGFREQEASAVIDSLHGTEWIFGHGLGGTFELVAPGTNPAGNSYAHAWPLWILLKGGLVGLALAVMAFLGIFHRLLIRPSDDPISRRALGAAFAALLVSSLGVNSLPLAEGALVVGAIAAAAATGPATSRARRDRSRPSAPQHAPS